MRRNYRPVPHGWGDVGHFSDGVAYKLLIRGNFGTAQVTFPPQHPDRTFVFSLVIFVEKKDLLLLTSKSSCSQSQMFEPIISVASSSGSSHRVMRVGNSGSEGRVNDKTWELLA